MKCVIPGANIKVFGKAIHSLSKIGEELYLEPLETGLTLRTVNSSRSAYACFVFEPSFFTHYDDGSGHINTQDSPEDALKLKIGMKSCLSVFKSLSMLEKTVEKCKIHLDEDDCKLIFQLYCRHGIVKTHNLAFIECETLQAVFSKDLLPNILVAQTRLLCDVVMNFQTTQEEVSLIVNPERASFKNYTEDEPDPSKVIHTELGLEPDEFDNYQVGIDTEVTFCLKELRAILGFSESANLPISIHFESAGKPIVFTMTSDASFEANFVLATLAEKSASQITQSQQSTQAKSRIPQPQPNISHRATPVRPSSRLDASSGKPPSRLDASSGKPPSRLDASSGKPPSRLDASSGKPPSRLDTSSGKPPSRLDTVKPGTSHQHHVPAPSSLHDEAAGGDHRHTAKLRDKNSRVSRIESAYKELCEGAFDDEEEFNTDFEDVSMAADSGNKTEDLSLKNINNNKSSHGNTTIPKERKESESVCQNGNNKRMEMEEGEDDPGSPEIPVQKTMKAKPSVTQTSRSGLMSRLMSDSEEEEKEDLVPGTPPSKRFKSIFYGLSQSTCGGSQVSQKVKETIPVLAEDTDEED